MQPRMTQVPPTRYSSAIITLAPWPAAIRAARTPPDPAPITNRSTSWLAMVSASLRGRGTCHLGAQARFGAQVRSAGAREGVPRPAAAMPARRAASQVVTLLLHLGPEAVHHVLRHGPRP